VTLLAFAAERRAEAPLLFGVGARLCPSTCPARTALSSKPTHTAVAVDRWDRQTDRRTLDRYIDSVLYTMRAVPIQQIGLWFQTELVRNTDMPHSILY